MFTGIPALALAASIWFRPGSSDSNSPAVSMIRAPTTPGAAAQSATSSAMVSDCQSNGLISPNFPGWAAYTCWA